jgi:hypothetical protein
MNELLKKGENIQQYSSVPIGRASEAVLKVLKNLRVSGSTALGPAMSVAVGIASKTPGSKIMVCTGRFIFELSFDVLIVLFADGMANLGVGNLNSGRSEFYQTIAREAKNRGVSISVITMEGEDCSMENLGTTADITNGTVEIVNPNDLRKYSSECNFVIFFTRFRANEIK